MTKDFKLPAESLAKFAHLESSISHWSHEHTVLSLRAKKALDGIDNLFQARQKVVDDFLRSNGVDMRDVESVNVSPDGTVVVEMKPSSQVAPSNGAPVEDAVTA